MVTAAIAAAVAAAMLVVVVAVFVARARTARSDRRFEAVLGQLEDHMKAISQSLQRVVERSGEVRASGLDELELTVDFDDLLRRLAAEASARTEAVAATVRVRGPAGEPAVAYFGAENGNELLEAPLGTGARPVRAVTINWAYKPAEEHEADSYTSALVVPIVEAGVETGTLAAYARVAGVFGPEHVRALEALAEEAAPAITSARRFAEAERALTDPLTGVRNRKGYEAELERAVTRAHATGLPLSLLLLHLEDGEPEGSADQTDADLALQSFAALLLQVTRTTDVVCRRGADAFGIVLPETTGDAARRLYVRLREEAARAALPLGRQLTFAAGLVEWRPSETSDSFDVRAAGAVGHSRVARLELGVSRTTSAASGGATSGAVTREEFDARLAQEVVRARRLTQPLTLLVLDVDVLQVSERLGQKAADRVLGDVETRVAASLGNGDLSCRVGTAQLAVILPGSNAAQAEGVFAALQASLESKPPGNVDRLPVSAGITELAGGDDPAGVFGRAEHALRQARQAGEGTVVVAMASDDPHR